MAESLAVRYRPRRFADVAGQAHVCAVLLSAAARQSPPQQILLSGPSGLGKTTTARIFAASLFCEHRSVDGDACGTCGSCLETADGRHPDVIELDAASNGGKDEIRELATRAVLVPLRSRWKVYIVDEAHGLTGPGSQAFLKLLEEPPAHCIFMLATTDPGKLPAAVRGRCVELDVLPATLEQKRANLQRIAAGEEWELPDSAVDAIVDASDPSLGLRGTVMTLEKLSGPLSAGDALSAESIESLLGVLSAERLGPLTNAIAAGDRAGALLAYERVQSLPGGAHVRHQLTSWARRRLLDSARSRSGLEQALHVYETLVEAPTYPGAFEVALARATAPALADTPQALRALVEQVLSLTPSQLDPTLAPPVANDAPPDPADQPVMATDAVPASSSDEPTVVDAQDPRLLALLNFVARTAPRASLVLRRAEVLTDGEGLVVRISPELTERARETALGAALAAASPPAQLVEGS